MFRRFFISIFPMHGWVCLVSSLRPSAGLFIWSKKSMKWDIVELAAVEISLVFFFIAIVTGSIWAKPSWGTFWTWDARLTTAAILEMIYLAYLLLRQGIEDPERRARFGAVYTLIGAISVPVSFLSIRIWQTIHPAVIGAESAGTQGSFGMTPPMLSTMFFCLATFSVIFVTLLWYRVRLGILAEQVDQHQVHDHAIEVRNDCLCDFNEIYDCWICCHFHCFDDISGQPFIRWRRLKGQLKVLDALKNRHVSR